MENQKNKRKKKSEEEYVQTHYKYIPDDLLPAILCKLSARFICRFKCVCKSWRDLFEDEEFINSTRAKPPFEFEMHKSWFMEYFTIDERGLAISKGKDFYIGGCKYRRCNNLICYGLWNTFSVFNLSTQQTYVLPLPPSASSDLELEFDFDFGLDPCTKEYKVLLWTDRSTTPDFYILALQKEGRSSSPWRRPSGLHTSNFHFSYEKTFTTTTGMIYLVDVPVLISFNLATEKFRIILLPHQVFQRRITCNSYSLCQLFEYEGCLCWVELGVIYGLGGGMDEWVIIGMWMLKDHVDIQWVTLMEDVTLPLPMPINVSFLPTTWSQKHSQFSSTRSGEIMITISSKFGRNPYILLYSFLDCKFKTMEIYINREDEDDSDGFYDDGNESCRELIGCFYPMPRQAWLSYSDGIYGRSRKHLSLNMFNHTN